MRITGAVGNNGRVVMLTLKWAYVKGVEACGRG